MPTNESKEILKGVQLVCDEDTTLTEFTDSVDYSRSKVLYRFNTWTNAKVEAGININHIFCPNCDVAVSYASRHWDKCGEPELSQHQKDIIKGILMSDATISNEAMTIYSSNYSFIQWISDELSWMAYQPFLNDTGENRKKRNIKSGFDKNNNGNKYKDMYAVSVPKHSYIERLQNWYTSGKKRFPEDKVNKTVAKIWYCGDGGLNWSGNSKAYAEIRAPNESDRDAFLESLFQDTPFSPSSSSGDIRFGSETDKFLDWLGESPNGMEYKWENYDREKYNLLKP